MLTCPSIDWISYFRDLDGRRQDEFERALASRGISLGEYMEIIEHAAMDACARTILSGGEPYSAEEMLPVASLLLSCYVRRKREMIARVTSTSDAVGHASSADKRRERQSTIHRRLEEIKASLDQP